MPRFSLNNVLPWLSIRSKLIIAFAGLSVLPVILVGIHGVFSNVRLMEKIALENLTHDVLTIKENTSNFLGTIQSDLRLIRHSSSFEEYVREIERSPRLLDNPFLRRIREELLAFARTKSFYYQLRLIDNDGDELAHIEATTLPAGGRRCISIPEGNMRSGRERFYFLLVDQFTEEQIAFVPSELIGSNDDNVPVVSFAMPIVGKTRRLGILIANVYASDLFRAIETRRHLELGGKVAIVNADGYYVYHSERKTSWNKLLASRDSDRLQRDFPSGIVDELLSGREGTITEGSSEIIAYAPLFVNTPDINQKMISTGFVLPSFVFESIPRETILSPVYSFAATFAGFLILFLAVATGLGLLATRQFTRPIAALRDGAEIIARGNYSHRLHVETHDEIEMLAHQFNSMAGSLESHVKEISRHRTRLEELVEQRTHELAGEKTKLQTILDNIPSAIVLLDRQFHIQSASAAFTSITGRKFYEVKGQDCRSIFCHGGLCKECVCRRALESRRIEYHVDLVNRPGDEERFLEHLAIPMVDGQNVGAFLEIITDVTERKKLERHLVQSEKLAAAGEMSAIIAHEFRNSLTSMKMILQLHLESKRLSRSEKKSLMVALNSIGHMENVVTELLGFASPRPMEFHLTSLNDLIEESLVLVQPQILKQQVIVSRSFDPTLPRLPLDASHIKEAFVNILLNAVQATADCGMATRQGEIRILTKRHRLHSTMRDFVMADGRPNNGTQSPELEVILECGRECALVEIQDTGCGMSEHQLKKIFDPFFTTKTNGTGLGLPMVKRTVNAHGGIVTASSTEGKGSIFSLFLPLPGQT